ncbi:glycosyltransferase family 4 protein [Coraliomargarita sp. W4R72]
MSVPHDPLRIAFLGDFVPRMCGIATFTHDLHQAIAKAAPAADCYVTAVTDKAGGYDYPPDVRLEFQEKDLRAYRRTADFLNFQNAEVLCVQHEFGIYGGPAGAYLLLLLKEVRMPIVTTLHTVLETPTTEQRKVMLELARLSDRLVVMGQKGVEILHEVYGVPVAKVDVIAHGIPDLEFGESALYKEQFGVSGRQVLLTFGLIGPGKGIEYAIKSLPKIIERHPEVVYLIIGATHPNLLEQNGEGYRLSLTRLAEECGVEKHVIFHNRFVSIDDLKEFIGATDIYLTPYLDKGQITSGTLAYAFGAGKAVVSTPYWHAEELLADGRGALVPFRDSDAIAEAVCGLLDQPERMQKMQHDAYALGRQMTWPAVAEQYLESFGHALADRRVSPRTAFADWNLSNRPQAHPPRRLEHIVRMSDATGIFQHAIYNVPNFHEGYCVDDNARAFILCILLAEQEHTDTEVDQGRLLSAYMAFMAAALDYETGRFRNFMSHGRQWLEHAGSEDSHGRSLWATGLGAARAPDQGFRKLSTQLFQIALPVVESFTSPRAWAFALLGIHEFLNANEGHEATNAIAHRLTQRLIDLWNAHHDEYWLWFERSVTYENARLCQALILSGQRYQDAQALEIGLKSLRWLVSIQTTKSGCFRPIGNNGFYQQDGSRADFDQQPVEAQAVIAACKDAYRATQDPLWLVECKRAFEWFLGRNDLNLPLYDFSSGACSDGLHVDRVSENQGAESTLAFHLSLSDMNATELETSSRPRTH